MKLRRTIAKKALAQVTKYYVAKKTRAWRAVDHHYIPKGLNALKKDSGTPGRAPQKRSRNRNRTIILEIEELAS